MNSQRYFFLCSLSIKIWERQFPQCIWQKEQRGFVRWFLSLGHPNNGVIINWSLRFLYKGDNLLSLILGGSGLGPLYLHVLGTLAFPFSTCPWDKSYIQCFIKLISISAFIWVFLFCLFYSQIHWGINYILSKTYSLSCTMSLHKHIWSYNYHQNQYIEQFHIH